MRAARLHDGPTRTRDDQHFRRASPASAFLRGSAPLRCGSFLLVVGPISCHVVTTRVRARRLPPADRRQQLLACAIRAFAERGIERAGHADVARLAAVSPPTVFSYYRSRADLVDAVLIAVAAYYEAMADRFHAPGRPAAQALLEHAVAFATSMESDPDHARVLLEWSTAIRDESWPRFLHFQRGILDRCERTIRQGQRDGSIGSEIEPDTAALVIVSGSWMVIQMRFMHWPAERVHRFMLAQLRGALGPEAVARALG